jgi:hypothetical protein
MDRKFRWKETENQPTAAEINCTKPQDIAKKCPVRLRIFAVKKKVATGNHAAESITACLPELTRLNLRP